MIGAAYEELVAGLADLDVWATSDPSEARVPGALIALRSVTVDRLDGGTTTVPFTVYLMAGDYATPHVMDELGKLLVKVAPLLASPDVPVVNLNVPGLSGSALPALVATINVVRTPA